MLKISRDTARGIFGVFLALAIIFLIHLVKPTASGAPDFSCDTATQEIVTIDIRNGETGSEIAQELFEKYVTKSSAAFFRVAVSDERSGTIAPGTHLVQMHLCAKEALEQLLDRNRISNQLVIPEGAWNREIKKYLSSLGFTSNEIEKGFRETSKPTGFLSLEGLLYPAQYNFESSTSVSSILKMATDRSFTELQRSGVLQGSKEFTPSQLLTIASLVQAEGDEKDFAKISQVVRNRITKGMPLQFDSTVHYIKGTRGSVFLSTDSTYIDSPYNTYRRYGLPPTPINNPGFPAMYAATHPENGPWLFFITVAPGDTRFTESFDEFTKWKVLYKKNLAAGKFGKN